MKIVTSLSFQGQCREALEFYARILGGKVTAAFPFGEGPPDMPPEFAPNIDKPKNGFDVSYHTDDLAKARQVFDALSEGGKVGMAFAETFWSPGFGSLTDRFGIPWMVNTNPAPDWKPGV